MTNLKILETPVNFDLTSVDSNALVLMNGFRQAARKQGVSRDLIQQVQDEATCSDYDHLLQVLIANTEVADIQD